MKMYDHLIPIQLICGNPSVGYVIYPHDQSTYQISLIFFDANISQKLKIKLIEDITPIFSSFSTLLIMKFLFWSS